MAPSARQRRAGSAHGGSARPHRHRRGRRGGRHGRGQGQDLRQGAGGLRLRRRPLRRRRRRAGAQGPQDPRRRGHHLGLRGGGLLHRQDHGWSAHPGPRLGHRGLGLRRCRPEDQRRPGAVRPGRRRGAAPAPAADPPHPRQVGLGHLPPQADDPPCGRGGLTTRRL
ncbi:hypothetical protein SGPA1_11308 [Streptomyces misionensis JCM 4497]